MSLAKKLLILIAVLLVLGAGALGILHQNGYFNAPQVALRELEKLNIPATPESIHKATSDGDLTTLTILSRAELDFRKADSKGRTPLHLAIQNKHLKLLPQLRENGYDLNARDNEGNSALSLLLDQGQYEVATQLIREGASPDYLLPNNELALPGYHKTQRINDVAFLLNHGANPDSTSDDGQSTLALALKAGHAELACQLLEKGASATTLINNEPALTMILQQHENWNLTLEQTNQIITSFIEKGADPEQADSRGQRPIQIALKNNLHAPLKTLFPEINNVQNTLWLAIENNNLDAAEALLHKGANVEEIGPHNETPLIHALRHDNAPLLNILLSAKADPNQFAPQGQRALFYTLALKNEHSTSALLSHENSPELDIIMESPVSEEFRDLFDRKGLYDWYCRNETGLTPLMTSVMLRNLPVTEQLLAFGEEKVSRYKGTKKGVYAIQMAAANADVKMQQLLIGVSYEDEDQVRNFIIDLSEQKVTYYKNGKVTKTSRISSGKSGFRTPTGKYVITDRTRHKKSNIYDSSPMPYFQRFSCKAIGFHEGNTYSRFASHGCIRLPLSTAKYFWQEAKIGDRVTIQK